MATQNFPDHNGCIVADYGELSPIDPCPRDDFGESGVYRSVQNEGRQLFFGYAQIVDLALKALPR